MQLYLMQHGLAQNEEQDPTRPLSSEGIEQVKATARGIRRLGLDFVLIVTSPKRRAQQTAALVAEAVRYPYSDIVTTEVLLPKADPAGLLAILDSEADEARVLAVGHLPHLANFVSSYAGGTQMAFTNAGLAGLECFAHRCQLTCLLTGQQIGMLG